MILQIRGEFTLPVRAHDQANSRERTRAEQAPGTFVSLTQILHMFCLWLLFLDGAKYSAGSALWSCGHCSSCINFLLSSHDCEPILHVFHYKTCLCLDELCVHIKYSLRKMNSSHSTHPEHYSYYQQLHQAPVACISEQRKPQTLTVWSGEHELVTSKDDLHLLSCIMSHMCFNTITLWFIL